ncbi:hypothetical protein Droror1_Dr00022312 [Drosera rotundifolia]
MNCSNSNATWDWQGGNYHLQKNSYLGLSENTWSGGVTLNQEDLSYMCDEATPVKDCGDFHYHVNGSDIKALEGSKETMYQVKRRRMLQFGSEIMEPPFHCENVPTSFINTKDRIDSIDDVLLDVAEWEAGFQEDVSLSGFEALDQAESWLADCLNDSEMLGSSEPNSSGTSDGQNDHTEDCSVQSRSHAIGIESQPCRSTSSIIIKGKKAFFKKTSGKITSSVAYPFTFVKPCGAHGDVTLKDINQKILSPALKPKQSKEDPLACYPTSAFSGKPVVGKTKIRIEGGKGSITIMRTKG